MLRRGGAGQVPRDTLDDSLCSDVLHAVLCGLVIVAAVFGAHWLVGAKPTSPRCRTPYEASMPASTLAARASGHSNSTLRAPAGDGLSSVSESASHRAPRSESTLGPGGGWRTGHGSDAGRTSARANSAPSPPCGMQTAATVPCQRRSNATAEAAADTCAPLSCLPVLPGVPPAVLSSSHSKHKSHHHWAGTDAVSNNVRLEVLVHPTRLKTHSHACRARLRACMSRAAVGVH